MLQQIIDRRLAGKNKSIGNRERFLRRYQEQIREAVRARRRRPRHPRHRAGRGHPRCPSATSPSRCSATARAARARSVHPGNQEYVRGDRIERPQGRRRRAAAAAAQASDSGEGEDDFVFHLTKEEFMQVFFDDLALPHLMRTQLGRCAGVEEPARRLLERRHAEQPARGALDARRDRPAHRAWAAARARELRELEEQLARAAKRSTDAARRNHEREQSSSCRSRRCARASSAFPTSIRSTCAFATACACRCRPARR